MTRRPGLSLVEVLSALFIMGIGLISLFTLMPYGALQYAAAFKDDRTAQCANAAEAYMRTYWKERVLEPHPNSGAEPGFRRTPGDAMDDPNSDPQGITPASRVFGAAQKPPFGSPVGTPEPVPALVPGATAGATDPSYPVFIDPMGWVARQSPNFSRWWVAEGSGGVIARRTLHEVVQFTPNNPLMNLLTLRTCSLMDGLTMAPDGRAAEATGAVAETTGAVVQKELRYNWLWVLQRPNNGDQTLSRMTIVVFDKRSHLYAPTSAEQAGYTPIAAAVGSATVSFATGTEPAGLRKGMWLLDGTTTYDSYMGTTLQYYSKIRNANWYRVVSVTPNGAQVDVELHQPLKPDTKTRFVPNTTTPIPDALFNERRFIQLAGVADVYEKAPLSNPQARP